MKILSGMEIHVHFITYFLHCHFEGSTFVLYFLLVTLIKPKSKDRNKDTRKRDIPIDTLYEKENRNRKKKHALNIKKRLCQLTAF